MDIKCTRCKEKEKIEDRFTIFTIKCLLTILSLFGFFISSLFALQPNISSYIPLITALLFGIFFFILLCSFFEYIDEVLK